MNLSDRLIDAVLPTPKVKITGSDRDRARVYASVALNVFLSGQPEFFAGHLQFRYGLKHDEKREFLLDAISGNFHDGTLSLYPITATMITPNSVSNISWLPPITLRMADQYLSIKSPKWSSPHMLDALFFLYLVDPKRDRRNQIEPHTLFTSSDPRW